MSVLSFGIEPKNTFPAPPHNQVAVPVFTSRPGWGRILVPGIAPIVTLHHMVFIPFLNLAIGESPVTTFPAGEQQIKFGYRTARVGNGGNVLRTAVRVWPQTVQHEIGADPKRARGIDDH